MTTRSLIIVGPGGIGKSPLDSLLRDDIVRVDPYRLRAAGPRDSHDVFYAHPRLHNELSAVFKTHGDEPRVVHAEEETIEWFPKSRAVFFTVRGEWQCLMVNELNTNFAKLEIYAPVLPSLLKINDFSQALGIAKVLVLHPAMGELAKMETWQELESNTEVNCQKRGDTQASVKKRVSSVAAEAKYWKQLIVECGAIEAKAWPFPEYVCRDTPTGELRKNVVNHLCSLDKDLGQFFDH